jgi:Ni,Fe-hydrogenase III small subunit
VSKVSKAEYKQAETVASNLDGTGELDGAGMAFKAGRWERMKRVLAKSVHIRHVDAGSCNGCDWEMNHLLNPIYDIQRLGFDFAASPRHADFLMVTGGVTRNLEAALRKTYAATPEPRVVVAVGSCACSGGVFQDSYALAGGVDKILPVQVYIPGCPPRPQALIHGLMLALDKAGC